MTHYVIHQLAPDHATYGADAGRFIVTSADQEREFSGPMGEDDARMLAASLNACLAVVNSWDRGDLAGAARLCAAVVEDAAASSVEVAEPAPVVIEVQGGVVVDVRNLPPGTRYEVIDRDQLESCEPDQDRPETRETPWGTADSVREIAPGIVRYDTPSHGGYYVSPARVATMPKPLRDFQPWAGPNWYEEDCDWAVVALAFPKLFPAEAAEEAMRTIQGYKPELYAELVAARSAGGRSA